MIGWVDASSGASGDMLLGAVIGAGVPLGVIREAVAVIAPEAVTLTTESVTRGGFAATRCHVGPTESQTRRTWRDVAALLRQAGLDAGVRRRAHATFERLANAEATVHAMPVEEVHFHEVGALDAIADVVGVCAGLEHLRLDELVVSPVAVGSGTITSAHGTMPVPPPAVAELLRNVPSYSGPVATEMCTPTGAALLTSNATAYGSQPGMVVERIGVGAGGTDPVGHPNVLRLFLGKAVSPSGPGPPHGTDAPLVIEANVDDLDPRLWPDVIAALLCAGASDAWLTPILMKKGRPAHTLSVLVAGDKAEQVRTEIFRQTSSIGVREVAIGKHALDRETRTVPVDGHPVRVKLALDAGHVVNAQPEYDDVAAVASSTGRPIKQVLAEAIAASRDLHC
ncbi:MAG: nickel pincer cofactor biosynthesis protein LarC [Actinomycetota bacterium]|nr:nickel pincer cofactor biosynthesis protein LarC [Actinomycetota bacterium]